ncbi:MAG: hypothetical protein BJ554DRAFT_4778, partial [Olpidium bornovanus]
MQMSLIIKTVPRASAFCYDQGLQLQHSRNTVRSTAAAAAAAACCNGAAASGRRRHLREHSVGRPFADAYPALFSCILNFVRFACSGDGDLPDLSPPPGYRRSQLCWALDFWGAPHLRRYIDPTLVRVILRSGKVWKTVPDRLEWLEYEGGHLKAVRWTAVAAYNGSHLHLHVDRALYGLFENTVKNCQHAFKRESFRASELLPVLDAVTKGSGTGHAQRYA